MKSVYCAVISRHDGHWGMFMGVQAAASMLYQKLGMQMHLAPHIGDSLVCRARQNCLGKFLETDADYLFTLDDDISIPADALVKLIEADKDMIGGLYRLKKEHDPKDNIIDAFAFRPMPGSKFTLGADEVVPVTYVSTGCIMHKRSFIEKLVTEYPELAYTENITGNARSALYMPFIHNGEYLSEDWAFCERARTKGHEIYAHVGVVCGHWGLKEFKFEELVNGNSTSVS